MEQQPKHGNVDASTGCAAGAHLRSSLLRALALEGSYRVGLPGLEPGTSWSPEQRVNEASCATPLRGRSVDGGARATSEHRGQNWCASHGMPCHARKPGAAASSLRCHGIGPTARRRRRPRRASVDALLDRARHQSTMPRPGTDLDRGRCRRPSSVDGERKLIARRVPGHGPIGHRLVASARLVPLDGGGPESPSMEGLPRRRVAHARARRTRPQSVLQQPSGSASQV